jgi:hypothetical protein
MGFLSGMFGSPGYSIGRRDMQNAQQNMSNAAGTGYTPGSSGYDVNPFNGGSYGVNQETGRSFTTLPQYSDYVKEGSPEAAFSGIANAQKTAMQRGLAGGNRAAVSQFGRSGLGLGGIGGALAANRRSASQGMADIMGQNKMGLLNYGTDMYKYNRGQSLAEEAALRNARANDNSGQRADYGMNLQGQNQQFNMDRAAQNDRFNQYLQNYQAMSPNATQGTQGWLAPLVGTGIQAAMAGATGGASLAPSVMGNMPGVNAPGSAGGGVNFDYGNMFNVGYDPYRR